MITSQDKRQYNEVIVAPPRSSVSLGNDSSNDESVVVTDGCSFLQCPSYLSPSEREYVTVIPYETVIKVNPASHVLTVATYNILALSWAEKNFSDPAFHYLPYYVRNDQVRREAIVRRIESTEAKIVCLQEVQDWPRWKRDLEKIGFTGIFSHAENQAKRPPEARIGVAMIWKKGRYEALYYKRTDIASLVDYRTSNPSIAVPPLSSAALVVNFVSTPPADQATIASSFSAKSILRFTVATAHIYWDPDHEAVKLEQVLQVQREIHECARSHQSRYAIFAGDFNSHPASRVYRHMLQYGWKSAYAMSNCFTSQAMGGINAAFGEPAFTNYTPRFQDCIDYIMISQHPYFHLPLDLSAPSTSDVKLLSIGRLPTSKEYESAYKALPNEQEPSDHLPLVARFLLDSENCLLE